MAKLVRKPTPRQIAAYEMRKVGKTWADIARALNCSEQSAAGAVRTAERRGLPELPRGRNTILEAMAPAQAISLADAGLMGDDKILDIPRIRALAEQTGMPARLVNGLIYRIQGRYAPVMRALKKFSDEERAAKLLDKADMLVEYIDDISASGAGLKELAAGIGVLIDRAQLLRGQPTAIYDVNQRKSINELLPKLLAEAKRRGITVDGQFERVPEPVK